MTTLALTYTKLQKKVQSGIDAIEVPSVNWKMICYLGFFACLAMLVFYAFQINSLTKGSFLVNKYEKQLASLEQENKKLQISFAESSFLGQALAKVQNMNFQRVVSVKYIHILNNATQLSRAGE